MKSKMFPSTVNLTPRSSVLVFLHSYWPYCKYLESTKFLHMLTVLIKMPTWKMNLFILSRGMLRVKTKTRTTVGLLDRQWTYIFRKLIQCLRNNHFCAWSNSCASMLVNMKKWKFLQPLIGLIGHSNLQWW